MNSSSFFLQVLSSISSLAGVLSLGFLLLLLLLEVSGILLISEALEPNAPSRTEPEGFLFTSLTSTPLGTAAKIAASSASVNSLSPSIVTVPALDIEALPSGVSTILSDGFLPDGITAGLVELGLLPFFYISVGS